MNVSARWKLAAGTALVGIGFAGVVAASDGTAPAGFADPVQPVPCYESVSGQLICESAIAGGSPVATQTPVLPEKTEIDTITELPSTGTGSSR